MNLNIKITIVFALVFRSSQVICQTCESIYGEQKKYKEIYDYLGSHKFGPTNKPYTALSYGPNNYIYPNDANEAGDQFSYLDNVGPLLESLIRMYEITHDKAYLIKAINKSIQLIKARGGATAPDQYAWASGLNV
jgi:hypothetical protein